MALRRGDLIRLASASKRKAPAKMTDVFLSYCSEDRERVGVLARALQVAGWSVFWDVSIAPGKAWRSEIAKQVATARIMLVVWSRCSINSDWVKEEAEQAKKRRILFPIRIDPVLPPFGFGEVQAMDFSAWDGSADAAVVRQLLDYLSSAIGAQSGPSQRSERPTQPSGVDYLAPGDAQTPLRPDDEAAPFSTGHTRPTATPRATIAASNPVRLGRSDRANLFVEDLLTLLSKRAKKSWGLLIAVLLSCVAILFFIGTPCNTPRVAPAWLADDFVPTVHEAARLGQDLAVASGHYLEKKPSSKTVFMQQVADVRFVVSQYNKATQTIVERKDIYIAKVSALEDLSPAMRSAAASVMQCAESQLTLQELPEVDQQLPIDQQWQSLLAHWREYETASVGPLRQISDRLESLEQEMFRYARLPIPACSSTLHVPIDPQPSSNHESRQLPKEVIKLADYANALRNLERSVVVFEGTPITDLASLRTAASPLKAAIQENNAAYAKLSSRRLALTIAILNQTPRSRNADAIVCALGKVEEYQLDQMSPLLNSLLVNVIASWRDQATDELLADVRAQQQRGWRELDGILQFGVEAFSLVDRNNGCKDCSE
jgi:TIR domain